MLVHFLDNALSPALLKTLSKQSPGAPWYGFARIIKDLEDPDFCEALKRSGCRMLKLGLESGDQVVLDSLCKGIDLASASSGCYWGKCSFCPENAEGNTFRPVQVQEVGPMGRTPRNSKRKSSMKAISHFTKALSTPEDGIGVRSESSLTGNSKDTPQSLPS